MHSLRPFTGYAAESENAASQEQKLDVAKLRPQPDTAKPYKAQLNWSAATLHRRRLSLAGGSAKSGL